MLRSVKVWTLQALLIAIVAVPVLGACAVRGIGDPCVPEAIPDPSGMGFSSQEVYVETSSVQCRTRTCMVFRLDGNPERVLNEEACLPPNTTVGCVDPEAAIISTSSQERVFCTCRCSASGDANQPLCECTDGFHCVDVLTAGGVGVAGGYCVPLDLCTADEDCDSGSCNDVNGVCNSAI